MCIMPVYTFENDKLVINVYLFVTQLNFTDSITLSECFFYDSIFINKFDVDIIKIGYFGTP